MEYIRVEGTHYACGFQLGNKYPASFKEMVRDYKEYLVTIHSWEKCLKLANKCLKITKVYFPWVIDELEGAAKGAGVDFLELFICSIEELYTVKTPFGKCSDVLVNQGRMLVGHNNDLSPLYEEMLVIVDWNIPEEPRQLSVGVCGIFVSVGINCLGLCVTGNEVSPNDDRVGIPRLLLARVAMAQETFEDAVNVTLHSHRASSYNTIISSKSGEALSIEGSATDFELLKMTDGFLAHTNHYLSEKMNKYERDDKLSLDYVNSCNRCKKILDLLNRYQKAVNIDDLVEILSYHGTSEGNNAVCRHDKDIKTVFSFLADLENGEITVIKGNPCVSLDRRVFRIY
ncbi:MAG: C45 family peptidase [Patescibacteria group bacterium]